MLPCLTTTYKMEIQEVWGGLDHRNFLNSPGGSDYQPGMGFISINNTSVHPTNMKAHKKP